MSLDSADHESEHEKQVLKADLLNLVLVLLEGRFGEQFTAADNELVRKASSEQLHQIAESFERASPTVDEALKPVRDTGPAPL
jgi:hypothetical protein